MTTELRRALTALEEIHPGNMTPMAEEAWNKAITALKAALAEPVQEPVGWLESPHGAFRADPLYKMQFPSQLLHWQIALYTAPPRLTPTQSTHSADCWKWHHECAIARIERMRKGEKN